MTNPFASPTDYPEMLNKISIWTFLNSLLLTVIIGVVCPAAARLLAKYPIKVDVYGGLAVPILYIVPPVVIAVFARIVRLHDKVSDLFAIRESFDVFHILLPLAGAVGYPLDLDKLQLLRSKRRDLMNKTFYRYASSTEPKIQKHLIVSALDRWSWYWILVEFLTIGLCALVLLLCCGAYQSAAWLGTVLLAFMLLGIWGHRFCARTAHAEIREILGDPTRSAEVKAVFDAL